MGRPSFVSQKIFSKHSVAVHEIKPVLVFDLSKLLMYEFHYNYIGVKFGSGAKLLFTDTDSLVYEVKTDDVSENFYEDKRLFEFSDYPKDSRFYDPVDKKVICKMKGEVRGKIISDFVGLKSKMYSLVMADSGEI